MKPLETPEAMAERIRGGFDNDYCERRMVAAIREGRRVIAEAANTTADDALRAGDVDTAEAFRAFALALRGES